MALNDIYRMTTFTKANNQLGINVYHYTVAVWTTGGATLAEVAADLATIFPGKLKPCMGDTASYSFLQLQKIWPLPIELAVQDATGAGNGGTVSPLLPKQVTGMIQKKTLYGGRPFRGRTYVPFPTEDDNTVNGVPTIGYLANLVGLAGTIILSRVVVGATGTTAIVPVIYHERGYGNPPANQHTFTQLTATYAIGKFATQRSRGDYGRTNN